MTFPTRYSARNDFYKASHRTTTTNPKPLTDKPNHKQTSRKDKQTSRQVNHHLQEATGSRVETGSYFETLTTGESCTSLQYQWRVERMTICKFVSQVRKAILKELQQEYLVCLTDPEDWKKIEQRFRNRWNVPHAVRALDEKHIAIKKPKKSGSEYFNHKG